MRIILPCFMLVIGAAIITLSRSGADAFTLDRHNSTLVIDIDDSHETEKFLDSAESNNNQTSIENDSLEVKTTPIAADRQLRVDRDYSWEDLMDDISELDRLQPPAVGTSQPTGVAHLAAVDDSIEDVIEDLADAQRITLATTQTAGRVVAQQNDPRSSFGLSVAEDDFSLEDYADFVNADAIHLTAANNFHHLPDTLFSHPKSDDWFLVKHFMDDHYVWELGDELAKQYFWQPVKAPGAV